MIGFVVVKAVLLGSQFAAMSEQSAAEMVELKQSLDRGTEIALRVSELASRSEPHDSDRNSALIAAMFHLFGKVQSLSMAARNTRTSNGKRASAIGTWTDLSERCPASGTIKLPRIC
jgi:hypothetical protein